MQIPEEPRVWAGGIDLWMTLAALVIAILMIVLATLPAQGQTGVPAGPRGGGEPTAAPPTQFTLDRPLSPIDLAAPTPPVALPASCSRERMRTRRQSF
jgi:hypothetical protein